MYLLRTSPEAGRHFGAAWQEGRRDEILRKKGNMSWRTRLISLLVVYFAGFATAIYCLAPAPEQPSHESLQATRTRATLQSQELARSVKSGMHKCIAFSKEAAWQTATLIREKINESQARPDPAAQQPARSRASR